MFLDLVKNVSLLMALLTIYSLLARMRQRGKVLTKVLMGILFGASAIIGMMLAVSYSPGVFYDGRSIILTLAGLFGGWLPSLIAMAGVGLYRAILGGNGVWAGLGTILFCTLLGLAFRYVYRNRHGKYTGAILYLIGFLSHLIMLACQLLVLPFPAGVEVVKNIWLSILLIFPAATMLIGVLLNNEDQRVLTEVELKKSEELYHDLVKTSQDLIWQCDAEGRYTYLNPAWEGVLGYKINEMLGKKFSDFQTPEYAERDLKEFERLLQGDTVKGLETVHLGKDGQEIHLVFNAKFLNDEKGKPAGTRGTAYDVTKQKQAELVLLESEDRFRKVFEEGPLGIAMAGLTDGRFIRVNSALCEMLGYTEEEMMQLTFLDVTHPDHHTEDVEAVARLREGYNGNHRTEKRYIKKNGDVIWATRALTRITSADGKNVYALAMIMDITEQKQSELKTRESEDRYRSLFNTMNEGVALHQLVFDGQEQPVDYIIQDVNPRFETMVGLSRQQVIGQLASQVYGTDPAPYLVEYSRVAQTGVPTVFETYFPPLEKYFTISVVSPRIGSFATIFMDITEQKKMEEELKQSEQRLREVLDATPFPIAIVDPQDNQILYWSRSAKEQFGHTAPTAEAWYQIAYPDPDYRQGVIERWKPILENASQTHHAVNAGEYHVTCSDGAVRICELYATFLPDNLIVTFNDITQRKEAEQALQESEINFRERADELQTILDTVPAAVWIAHDPECRVITGNRAANHLLHLSPGRNASFSAPVEERPSHVRIYHNDVELLPDELPVQVSAAKGVEIDDFEEKLVFEDGLVLYELGSARPLFNAEGKPRGSVGVFLDITERKRAVDEINNLNTELEQRVYERTMKLQSANKDLESFSYMVSHDLRAPLRAINGFAEIIARRYRADLNEQAQHYFDNIIKASNRMANLIDDLLTYSRLGRSGVRLEAVPLDALLREIAGNLNAYIQEHHGTLSIPQMLPTVTGDQTLLTQVFTNLIENAIKFTQPGIPPQVTVTYELENEHVMVHVTDSGIGIPPEYQEKIFDMFQRLHSEDDYPGTGVGLATVRKSIEMLGGKIRVLSNVGEGSTFSVRLLVKKSDQEMNKE